MFPTFRRLQASTAYNDLLRTFKVDLKQAMIAKNTVEKNTIRSILATIKNSEIDGGAQNEFEVARVLNKMIKQRVDSAREFRLQERADLADVEEVESGIITKYVKALPVSSEDEVRETLEKFLVELKSQGDVPIRDVFKQINEELAQSWGSTSQVVKAMVPELYKKVFKL